MSRNTKVYRVRTKEDGRFRTRLVQARNPRKAASQSKVKGRLLSSSKVGLEELLGVGEFFRLGAQLMKEFEEEERSK